MRQRDPRAVALIAERIGVPAGDVWAMPETFAEACATLGFAAEDLKLAARAEILKPHSPLVKIADAIAAWVADRKGNQ